MAAPQATMMGETLFTDPLEEIAAALPVQKISRSRMETSVRHWRPGLVFLSENGLLSDEFAFWQCMAGSFIQSS